MLPQLVVSGISSGMLYALIALSMTVVYRATTVVNFGHGDMVAAGAYAVFVFGLGFGLPFVGRTGAGHRVAVRRRRRCCSACCCSPSSAGPHLSLAMMALAVGFTLRGVERLEWGNDVSTCRAPIRSGVFMLGIVVITTDDAGDHAASSCCCCSCCSCCSTSRRSGG